VKLWRNMESQRIKILLDRYWEGISSVEEEAQLRAVFGTEVPKDEAQYSVLFSYRELAGSQKEEDFDLSFLPKEEVVAEKKRVEYGDCGNGAYRCSFSGVSNARDTNSASSEPGDREGLYGNASRFTDGI